MPTERRQENEWWRQKRWWIPGAILVLLVVLDLVAAFRFASDKDLRGSILGLLTPVVALLAGGAALLNFQETRRQNERTFETTQHQLELARDQFAKSQELQQRAQVTDRFSKAIEQLGQEGEGKLDVRIGAIYALEQIASESKDLHWPIMEVLTTHLRHFRRGAQQDVASTKTTTEAPPQARLPAEAQAIATVIGRRRPDQDPPNQVLDLHEVDLDGVMWVAPHLEHANLSGVHLKGAVIEMAKFRDADLSGADLQGVNLSRADLGGAILRGADLQGADLSGADLQGANFFGANLQGADVGATNLEHANLRRADLRGVYLAQANLQGAKLEEADLHKANLILADLQGAALGKTNDLNAAHLQEADLVQANLQEADLTEADLQGANLSRAHLQGAWLFGANLRAAYLCETNLSETVGLTQEQLDSAECPGQTEPPPGLTSRRPDGDKPDAG